MIGARPSIDRACPDARGAGRSPAPIRWRRPLALLLVVLTAAAACGKKGPPLAPLERLPRPPREFSVRRLGSDVYIRFVVPDSNTDNERPASLDSVEVYAMTGNPRSVEDFLEAGTLVASVKVRRPPPPLPPTEPGRPPPPPPPPRPFEPGVDQGVTVVVKETITPDLMVETFTELEQRRREDAARTPPPPPPVVTPPLLASPGRRLTRVYVAFGVNQRGREGPGTARVPVLLLDAPEPPGTPSVTYTADAITVSWTAPASARHRVQEPSVPTAPTAAPPGAARQAPASPDSATEPGPPTAPAPAPSESTPPAAEPAAGTETAGADPAAAGQAMSADTGTVATELSSRPVFPSLPGSSFNVYDVTPLDPTGAEGTTPAAQPASPGLAPDPIVAVAPVPINDMPIPETTLVARGIEFGRERCFAVRTVDTFGNDRIESESSPATCVTMIDTFAPAAPASLAAVAGEGAISLIWEANTEADLAGYLVLRAAAPGDTLQPLTPEPIKETTYRDETARPGVRYVYAVQAVDRATPPNVSAESNRVEDTAR